MANTVTNHWENRPISSILRKKTLLFSLCFPSVYQLSSPSTGFPLLNPPVLQDKTQQRSNNRVDDQFSVSLHVMALRGSLLSSRGLASIFRFPCQDQNCLCYFMLLFDLRPRMNQEAPTALTIILRTS